MTTEEAIAFRKALGLTQGEMAFNLGLSTRALQAIEAGKAAVRPIHTLAMERVALNVAIQHYDATRIPTPVQNLVLAVSALITLQQRDNAASMQ